MANDKKNETKTRLPESVRAVAEDAALEKEEAATFVNAHGQVVPEKYRGAVKYRIGQAHYRQGVYFEAGSVITVIDEIPSRTWTRVDAPSQAAVELAQAMKPEAPVEQRLADKSV